MTIAHSNQSNGEYEAAGSNKHAVLMGRETVVIENREIPRPKPGFVLCKVMSTGICGSDLSYYSKGGIGRSIVKAPLVLGHESSGIVVELGEGVQGFTPGQKVAIEPSMPCRTCRGCKEGSFNRCQNDCYLASPPTDGTLCQLYSCPVENLVKLPDNITWKEAGCIQPLAIAIHLARRAGLRAHQNVAVFGCGPLGQLCMAVAKAYGARTIIAIDRSPKRVSFAKQYAATHAHVAPVRPDDAEIMQWNHDTAAGMLDDAGVSGGLDLVIEATGGETCMQLGIHLLRMGGTFLQAGMGAPLSSFPTLQVATRELSVIGTLRYGTNCFQDGIDLIERGLIDIKPLITKTYPLDESVDAFKAVKTGQEIKIVIMNQGTEGE